MKYVHSILFIILFLPSFSFCADTKTQLQVFGGTANTDNANINVDVNVVFPPISETIKINGASSIIGVRYLYPVNINTSWNAAFEISNYEATSDNVKMDIWPLSFQVLYSFNSHAVIPYVGIGLMLAYYKIDFSNDVRNDYDIVGDGFASGKELLLGLSYPFNSKYKLFTEYRLRKMVVESETRAFFFPDVVTSRTSTNLDTNIFLLGISYSF